MKFVKLLVVLFFGLIAVFGLAVAWIVRIARIGGGVPAKGTHVAVDIGYVATRPLFLLGMAVIVALVVWLCRRWVFV